jgi:hypothetical protein
MPDGFPLGRWVVRQRSGFAGGALSLGRQQRLEELPGWVWDTRADSWEEGYRSLVTYVGEHGDARVPDAYRTPDGFRLGRWVSHQRIAFTKIKLGAGRQQRLESLRGWVWDTLSDDWERGYERTATYARDHGNSLVPQRYRTPDGFCLGSWVSNQRTALTKNKLSPKRQQRLELLPGWVWRTRKRG